MKWIVRRQSRCSCVVTGMGCKCVVKGGCSWLAPLTTVLRSEVDGLVFLSAGLLQAGHRADCERGEVVSYDSEVDRPRSAEGSAAYGRSELHPPFLCISLYTLTAVSPSCFYGEASVFGAGLDEVGEVEEEVSGQRLVRCASGGRDASEGQHWRRSARPAGVVVVGVVEQECTAPVPTPTLTLSPPLVGPRTRLATASTSSGIIVGEGMGVRPMVSSAPCATLHRLRPRRQFTVSLECGDAANVLLVCVSQ